MRRVRALLAGLTLTALLGTAGATTTLEGRTLRHEGAGGTWQRTLPDALGP